MFSTFCQRLSTWLFRKSYLDGRHRLNLLLLFNVEVAPVLKQLSH